MQTSGNVEKLYLCQVCTTKPASMVCSCVPPSVVLCVDCIPAHYRTAGFHNLGMINQEIQSRSNAQCVLCRQSEAAYICVCENKPTSLCSQCTDKHITRESLEEHSFISVKAFPYFTGPEYMNHLKARKLGVKEGKAKLMATLEQMNVAENRMMDHFEGIVTQIRKLQQDKLQEFRDMKQQFQGWMNSALEEVAQHMYEGDYRSDNWLVSTLRNYSTSPVEFHCFTFTSDASAVLSDIKKSVYLRLDLLESESVLSILTQNKVLSWDFRLKNFTNTAVLSSPVKAIKSAAWAKTDDRQIFLCGGRSPVSAAAFLINILDGIVQDLLPMKQARASHGLILRGTEACVFGGVFEGITVKTLDSAELYSFQRKKWMKLPNMSDPRSHFTPCRLEDRVFLVGGYGSSRVECFHWTARTFTLLQLQLSVRSPSTAFLHNGDLIVLQESQHYHWKVDSDEGIRKTSTESMAYYSTPCPVLVAPEVAFVLCPIRNVVIQLKLPEVVVQETYSLDVGSNSSTQ